MSAFADRIEDLAARARRERAAYEGPDDPPDEQQAIEYLREGMGPLVSAYVEGHTGGRNEHFPPDELATLEAGLNDWLALYARCYGHEIDPDCTVREAAQLLVDTRDVHDTARVLTHVPPRE